MVQTHNVFGDCLSGLDIRMRGNSNRRRLVLLQIKKMSLDIAETSSHLPMGSRVERLLRLQRQPAESAVVGHPQSHCQAVALTLAVGAETGEWKEPLATTGLE